MKHVFLVSLIALVSVTVISETGNSQSTAEKEGITNFYRDWSQATFKEGPEGYARFFADDGILLPPDEVPVLGRPAIRDWMQRTLSEATHVTKPQSVTQDDVKVSGDTAIVRTTLRGKRMPKSGGEAVPFDTKYLDVLRRTAQGRWEFVYRMWNSNRASRKPD